MSNSFLLKHLGRDAPGIDRYSLDLSNLYATPGELVSFSIRFTEFVECLPDSERHLVSLSGAVLTYMTESFLPPRLDSRPSLLLILGNPATQSVAAGVCFAYEGNRKREHRFWAALRAAGILDLEPPGVDTDIPAFNQARAVHLATGQVHSSYRVGIDVMFTLPTPASTLRWSGVAGIRRLFGSSAFAKLRAFEQERLLRTLRSFDERPRVVAFQSDAYDTLRSPKSTPYSLRQAQAGQLVGSVTGLPRVGLVAVPPTRFAHSSGYVELLRGAVESAESI